MFIDAVTKLVWLGEQAETVAKVYFKSMPLIFQ